MPLYRVEHSCEITTTQQDQLATAITKIHSEKFATPSFFVNIVFTDVTTQAAYVAGKRVRRVIVGVHHSRRSVLTAMSILQRTSNRLLGHVRTGPSRSMDDYNALTTAINEAWASIVGSTGDKELRATFILGDIFTGSEGGFAIPSAGSDLTWLREHYKAFEKKAQEGDEVFTDLIKEMEEREVLRLAVQEP